jgi:hypothetical protein
MDLNFLMESANPYETEMAKSKKLVAKWEKSGLLEGADIASQPYGKERMALILENQAKRLVMEANETGTGATFTAGTGEQWAGVALPLVRKVFADISSKEFVSVQPMTLPSGLVFFLEFKYGTKQPSDAPIGRFAVGDSMYGTTNQKNVDAYGGLYGAGRFGYSINEYSATAAAFTTGSAVTYGELNFNSAYSASLAAGQIFRLTLANASVALANLDKNGVRSFSVSSSAVNESNLLSEFTTYTAGTDTLAVYVSASSMTNQTATVFYSKQPEINSRGDFEDTAARPITGSNAIPEVNVELRSEPITAKTRKLKAKWTPEFSQDLNAYQSLDAEAELTSILSEYISMEVDLEILDMLIENANTVDYWSAQPGKVINANGTAFVDQSLTYTSQGAWFQTLGTKIQKVSNKIHQKTLRGGANFIVVSPTIATVLESIPGYAADTNGDKMTFAMGVQKAGLLNSRFKVFKNPYLQENVILAGFRGSQFLETGAVYAPYIPIMMTPLVYDPETFTPRKGLLTRYAKKIVRPEFYAKIFVDSLSAI